MSNRQPPQATQSKMHLRLTGLFLMLAASMAILVGLYWMQVLEPRLYAQAKSNSGVLAQSQSHNILRAALSPDPEYNLSDILNEILLLKDNETGQPFTLGVSLEFDYDVLQIPEGSLDTSRGEINCESCFEIKIPLYAEASPELIGITSIYASTLFFEQLRSDIRTKLIIGSTIFMLVIIFIWFAVSELVHKLQLSEKAAGVAVRAKSAFLANMSHEIRTPLNGILGMVHLLDRTKLSSQQQEYIKAISDSGDMLLVILNDILDLSKIEAGNISFIHKNFDLHHLIKSLILLMSNRTEEKGIKLITDISPEIPKLVNGDSVRVRQILLNLIGNAIKFTNKGSVTIQVRSISSSDESMRLEFAVIDTGIGLSDEARQYLFHEFTQADASISRKYGGTGLGLAICKRLIESMNGIINVESKQGKGSKFVFQIELNHVDTTELKQMEQHQGSPLYTSALNILLVEDVEINRKLATTLLTQDGHHVVEAVNGLEALDVINTHDIDVILMDIHMPEMDGLEATKHIRAMTDSNRANVPIIALTADIIEEQIGIFMAAGMDGYITKPFNPGKLNSEMMRIVAGRKTTHLAESINKT